GGRGTNSQQVFEDPNDPNNNNMIDVLNPEALTTGSRYNPAANTWSAITPAPEGRDLHVAATSGTDMFILGGNESYYTFNGVSGGLFVGETPSSYGLRYNISGNSWSVINTNGQPRVTDGSLVWTSAGLVLWGGSAWYYHNPSGFGSSIIYYPTNFGARYVPASDSWVALSTSTLSNRTLHSAVWTGTQMIIWGGRDRDYDALSNGARYNAAGNNWTSMTIPPASGEPGPRTSPSAVWTGDALIVWGGLNGGTALRSGGIYRPGIGWTNTPDIGAPSARFNHTAVWNGSEMIIWGGLGSFGGVPLNNGARFNVSSNKWFPLATLNAPRARALHTAVWTGREMIVWGGHDFTNIFYPQFLGNGGRYNPSNNTWTTLSNTPGVSARAGHTAVWTGNEMLLWGGYTFSGGLFGTFTRFSTGYRYNPALSNWTNIAAAGIAGRQSHTAVWNGTEMLVWGGQTATGATNTGARYRPGSNTWTLIPTNNAPTIRYAHTAVWADLSGQMIVWGGYDGGNYLRSGGLFDPFAGTWQATSNSASIPVRARHATAWTGKEMLIFDGGSTSDLNDGRVYSPKRTFYLYQKP
ncbi:MAG TPA: kelch repeat-containing protein, partial [Candidatus Acidoferrum sp.]|nr:kelch repeat-containing protein [Candidatus Acidoferrum sp.]